ncbi:MAG TPA: hypothetical protein VMW75_10395, partial [Thermoanaerobaculia bacterium]|nr:hypothetical protein [Thermoanaerobaculia bacterium]
MIQECPFPLVHGKSLAEACEPPPDFDLPDFRVVPVQEGIVVLIPVAMFEQESPKENTQGTVVSNATLGHLTNWEAVRNDNANRRRSRRVVPSARRPEKEAGEIDKDRQLASAFLRLRGLVGESPWTMSSTPYRDLRRSLAAAAADPNVCEDIDAALQSMPSLVGAMETFFAAIAMAASSEWWRLPV